MRCLENKGQTCHFCDFLHKPEEATFHSIAWKSKGKITVLWAKRRLRAAPPPIPSRCKTSISTPVIWRMMGKPTELTCQRVHNCGTVMLPLSHFTHVCPTGFLKFIFDIKIKYNGVDPGMFNWFWSMLL